LYNPYYGESTTEYWPIAIIILQLIFLEGILSIDNAAVIGALVSPLPDDQRFPRLTAGQRTWSGWKKPYPS